MYSALSLGRIKHSLIHNVFRQYMSHQTTCSFRVNISKKLRSRGGNVHVTRRPHSTTRIKLSNTAGKQEVNNIKASRRNFPEIKRLVSLARPERWKIAGAVCFLVVSSTVTLAVPFYMGRVIDIINTASEKGKLKEKLNYICTGLLVFFLIGGLANFGRVYLMQTSGQRIVKTMREKLFSSVIRQEVGFFDKTKTGELINRLSSDSSLIGNTLTFNLSDGLRALGSAGGAIGMMVVVSPKLTLIAMGIVPPVAVMSRIFGRYIKNITKDVQDSLAKATSVAEEKISNIRTVRAFARENAEITSYNMSVDKVLKLSYKEALARGIFWGSTGFSGNVIMLSVLYYGGMMMDESLLTIGELSAFLLYAAYVGVSIGGLSSFYTELMRGIGASTRIWELMDRQPLIPFTGGLQPTSPLQGEIDFQNISFSYPTRTEAEILSGLSLKMPAGTVTAVVGTSGSGKSTLGNLLLRFYDPLTGSILLDGQDVRELDPHWLRNQIGVVSQEPALFSCSIADNIKYGAADPSSVTMEMIEDAARQANAYMFIKSFPQQFDTMVGERGQMLSGGQKQRVALARAIIKNPRILLLDEATSALDSESEYYVKEALNRLMVGRTVITIAHRLSTIQSADQIAVLDNGAVAELGSYSQLIAMDNGIFRKLVDKQTIMS